MNPLILRAKRLAWHALAPFRKPKPYLPQPYQHFSIGMCVGDSPFTLHPAATARNPVITGRDVSDARARYVADPFLFREGQTWYMFFEILNLDHGKGTIGVASSSDGLHWKYERQVLIEPFHLSYPLVFHFNDQHYMIPESYQAGAIRLYRAEQFPYTWSYVCDLLKAPYVVDATPFQHDGQWWMFAEMGPDFRYDLLRLFRADDLQGPWHEHPASPIITGNQLIARPAGRVLATDGRLIRFAQECAPEYGMRVRAFEIRELTNTTYAEHEIAESPILAGSGAGWNSLGMHQIDVHPRDDGSWIAAVDGWHWGLTSE